MSFRKFLSIGRIMRDERRHATMWLDRDATLRCNKTVLQNDDLTAIPKWILREKKGSVTPSLSRSFAVFPLNAGEANENVRRDRIIHCPTKTGGASRLFGEWIHLARTTASLDGDRSVLVILEILLSDSFYVPQIHFEKELLPWEESHYLTTIIPYIIVIICKSSPF